MTWYMFSDHPGKCRILLFWSFCIHFFETGFLIRHCFCRLPSTVSRMHRCICLLEHLTWSICNGCIMLSGDAHSYGHLVPSHLGLAELVETNTLPKLVVTFRTLHFEHPKDFSRFYLLVTHTSNITTRGPKGHCRSPEYNECVKNLTSELKLKQEHFIPHAFKIITMHSVCYCSLPV